MTITNYGYTGTVDNIAWARLAEATGTAYSVAGDSDYRVEVVVGEARTVRVLPGSATGWGVRSVNDTNMTAQLNTISSGSRWDAVVLRRNWSAGGATTGTTLNVITGTSARAIPAGRNTNPGVLDDQPLALVQVTAGQTLPTAVVDLRVRASKVLSVDDLLALPSAPLGTYAAVGTTLWRRGLSNGSAAWLAMGGHETGFLGYLQGYTQMPSPYQGDVPRYAADPLTVQLGGMVYRSGVTFARGVNDAFDVTPPLSASIRPSGSRHLGLVNTWLGPGRLLSNAQSGRLEVQYPSAQTMTSNIWWVSFNGVSWVKE